jgi:hypothetical protein
VGRALSPLRRYDLKALLVGLCAFVLAAQAAAATSGDEASPTRADRTQRAVSLQARLEQKLDAARRHRRTIRFFRNHPALLTSRGDGPIARAILARAKRRLARVTKEAADYRRLIARREARREARRLARATPSAAIRAVFGPDAEQALAVASCESRLTTSAQNGQYRGLFQMGSNERRLFGYGATAHEQALAAHRYFVASGSDWSPWSCRWATV